MDVIDLANYGPALRAEIADGDPDPAGVAHLGLVWRDKTGHVGVRHRGRLVAHAGWLPIHLRLGERRVAAAGLGGVLVHPWLRGQGVGALVVRAVMDRMREAGLPVGVLFCREQLVPYYARLGWQCVDGEVVVDQPDGPVAMPLRTCWSALHPHPPAVHAPLTVGGLPF